MINERFKELYSEAVAYAFDQRFIASPDGPRELQDVINEKFAELIVAHSTECIRDVLREQDSTLSYEDCSKVQNRIKEFFGVE